MLMRLYVGFLLLPLGLVSAAGGPGDWPEPRQNPHLTAIQPLAGAMKSAPRELARVDLGRTRPAVRAVTRPGGAGPLGLCIVAGALRCYEPTGSLLWESH